MSRTRHRRFLALIGSTLGIALVLTSCFGGDDETEDTATTTQAPSLPAAPTTAAPPPATVPVTVPTTVAATVPVTVPVTVPTTVAATVPTTVVATPLIYTVQQGDTLFSIARQFDVSVDELIELNNIDNPDVIYVDATLTIPPPG